MLLKVRNVKRVLALVSILILVLAGLPTSRPVHASGNLGMPKFKSPGDPVPEVSVPYTTGNMMKSIYKNDLKSGGTSFWMDRMFTREGVDPSGTQLWTRGRALFMKTHDPSVIGFGGSVAYWENISNDKAYSISIKPGNFTENSDKRVKTPSYWKSEYNADGINIVEKKFITRNNVAVTTLFITNNNSSSKNLTLTVNSPYTQIRDGNELKGTVKAKNDLTTIYPKLSGDDMKVDGTSLKGTITVGAGETVSTKVQMGFITKEIPQSLSEYKKYKGYTPKQAFADHVKKYNKWWVNNIPYIDVPNENIEKIIYYRDWLNRFNFLDANMPGSSYQFPTSMEGVLGYNNAIVLTQPMHVMDLKYFRNPLYSYGDWTSVCQVSRNSAYRDNPGSGHWRNSYAQYLSEAAWRSYKVHGGQKKIIKYLAHCAEQDVKGQLDRFDENNNYLIAYSSPALTGNDADAVSFYYYGRANERTESAYVYGNAKAAAAMYKFLGNEKKAEEMNKIAGHIKEAVLNLLWDDSDKVFKQRDVKTGNLIPWMERNNYYPFTENLVPNTEKYKQALRLWTDPEQFPVFPFYTSNQESYRKAVEAGKPVTNNFSTINSTRDLKFYMTVLRDYPSEYITNQKFKKLLYWDAWAQYIDGNTKYPDANEFWANWNSETQTIDYRSWIHHNILGSYNFAVIEGAMGFTPRLDDLIELRPINIGWDHFTINNLRYHGRDLTIVWDKPEDGQTYYGNKVPEGYSVYINGKRVFTVDSLVHVKWNPDTGNVTFPEENGTVLFSRKDRKMQSADEVDLGNDGQGNGKGHDKGKGKGHDKGKGRGHDTFGNRIIKMFQKAGMDLSKTGDSPNLALDAKVTASYTDPDTSVSAAVDGFTINRPFWGDKGSGNQKDWYQIDFGKPTTFDNVKLYFYENINDYAAENYREPIMYTVQYYNGKEWVDVPGQYKSPTTPQANYNEVQFPAVTAEKMRVMMTRWPGYSSGLTEIQVYQTGVKAPKVTNNAPEVMAKQDPSVKSPLKAGLLGVASDDALPNGTLTSTWSLISGPGSVIFEDAKAFNTTATFTEPGDYVLKFTASDGELSSSDKVTVSVAPIPDEINVALSATPSASYTSPWEDVTAINDGVDPPRSNDTQNPRWGTWPQEGTQWVQLTWDSPVRVDKSDVYFFDDGGGVRLPASWKIQYWDGDSFESVDNPSSYETQINQYNTVSFDPVTTTKLRLVMESGKASVGVLEWKTYAVPPEKIKHVYIPTLTGEQPDLPDTVQKIYKNGSSLQAPVTWEPISSEQLKNGGTDFTIMGIVSGAKLRAHATVYVRITNNVRITNIADVNVTTEVGEPPQLPETVKATYNDGSVNNVTTFVKWENIQPSQYAQPGTLTVKGDVEGTNITAEANVTVVDDTKDSNSP